MNKLEMCRICTNFANLDSSTRLFERAHRGLLRQIKEVTGCLLKHASDLPQHICSECKENLKQAYAFRTRCLDSQLYFRSANYKEISNHELQDETALDEETVVELKSDTEKNEFAIIIKDELTDNDLTTNDAIIAEMISVENPLNVKESNNNKKQKNSPLKRKVKTTYPKVDFICDQCGNHFNCRQHFLTHLQRHTQDKPFQCEVCPDKFFTNSELKRHMRRHTGEKPFACKYCDRRFTDYSTRSKHERTHTNERPFSCSQCGKAFTTSYILKNHMLLHTGERCFKCVPCNKSFQRQTHLTVHFRSQMHKQTEERKLNLKMNLKEHEIIKHKEKELVKQTDKNE